METGMPTLSSGDLSQRDAEVETKMEVEMEMTRTRMGAGAETICRCRCSRRRLPSCTHRLPHAYAGYLHRPCVRLGETPEERLGVLGHRRPSSRRSLRPCTIRPRCESCMYRAEVDAREPKRARRAWAGRERSAVSGSWTCSMSLVAWAMRKAVAGRRSILRGGRLVGSISISGVCARVPDAVGLADTGAIARPASAATSCRLDERRSASSLRQHIPSRRLMRFNRVGLAWVPGQVSARLPKCRCRWALSTVSASAARAARTQSRHVIFFRGAEGNNGRGLRRWRVVSLSVQMALSLSVGCVEFIGRCPSPFLPLSRLSLSHSPSQHTIACCLNAQAQSLTTALPVSSTLLPALS
ncbi:hypothetical protein C8R47DRAFT_1172022 [Mycena vitilis]|nr:hypothetical protein C8R47DRAFT_1172022 [Mycena vitilis]